MPKRLFGSRGGIVLYDVTNTHFEGLCAKNPKARHGKNKQKRSDCRQVAIGMAFDERGLPLAWVRTKAERLQIDHAGAPCGIQE
jgi:transposase